MIEILIAISVAVLFGTLLILYMVAFFGFVLYFVIPILDAFFRKLRDNIKAKYPWVDFF